MLFNQVIIINSNNDKETDEICERKGLNIFELKPKIAKLEI